MQTVLFDQVVDTDYGIFEIVWEDNQDYEGDIAPLFVGQTNGLAGAADPGRLHIGLARRSGGSAVRIMLEADRPSIDDSYEDIVEVSIAIPPAVDVEWQTWAREECGSLDGIAPGAYRVRVSARGRDAGRAGEFEEGVLDFYLLQLWPAAPSPDAIVKTGSADAEYWHGAWGGNGSS